MLRKGCRALDELGDRLPRGGANHDPITLLGRGGSWNVYNIKFKFSNESPLNMGEYRSRVLPTLVVHKT